jgi:acyl-CoA thioester hydrolase
MPSMPGTGPIPETSFPVRYAETDAQRVVYHGAYVPWFEVGRTHFCDEAGYPYARMEAEGTFITVVRLEATYRKGAKYGDVVKVRTRFGGLTSRGCTFHYEVVLPSGEIAAEGTTRHLFVDAATGKPRLVPDGVREAFRAYLARETA